MAQVLFVEEDGDEAVVDGFTGAPVSVTVTLPATFLLRHVARRCLAEWASSLAEVSWERVHGDRPQLRLADGRRALVLEVVDATGDGG